MERDDQGHLPVCSVGYQLSHHDHDYKLINTLILNYDIFNTHDAVKNYTSSVENVRSATLQWFSLQFSVVPVNKIISFYFLVAI